MSSDEIVDITIDVLLLYVVGLGLNVYFPVDGVTKYVIITYWLGLVLLFFLESAGRNKPNPTHNTPRI